MKKPIQLLLGITYSLCCLSLSACVSEFTRYPYGNYYREEPVDRDIHENDFDSKPKKILLGEYSMYISGTLRVVPENDRRGARVIASRSGEKGKWRFQYKGNDLYEITWNGKALDSSGGKQKNGTPIIIWNKHGGSNQRWHVRREGIYFTIVNEKTGLALDLPGNRRTEGNPLQGYERNGTAAQKFILRK